LQTETLVLPPNWKKALDEKTSHPYFWNTKTGEVSWHLPPGTKTVSEKKPQAKPQPEPKPKPPPNVQMPTVTVSKSEAVEKEFKEKTNRPAPYKISKKPSGCFCCLHRHGTVSALFFRTVQATF
jgi:hypothetical protein